MIFIKNIANYVLPLAIIAIAFLLFIPAGDVHATHTNRAGCDTSDTYASCRAKIDNYCLTNTVTGRSNPCVNTGAQSAYQHLNSDTANYPPTTGGGTSAGGGTGAGTGGGTGAGPGSSGGGTGAGPVTATGPQGLSNPLGNFTMQQLLASILTIFQIILVPIIVFFILYAGFLYVTARGNPEAIKKANRALVYAIIGGVIIVGAQAILVIVQSTVTGFSTGP